MVDPSKGEWSTIFHVYKAPRTLHACLGIELRGAGEGVVPDECLSSKWCLSRVCRLEVTGHSVRVIRRISYCQLIGMREFLRSAMRGQGPGAVAEARPGYPA
jgi:hypothetical protein